MQGGDMDQTVIPFEQHGERICIPRLEFLHQALIGKAQQLRVSKPVATPARS
jgi:hypothetical protein